MRRKVLDSEFTTVYKSGNEMQAKVVCGYLQAQGVTAFMRNDTAFPYPRMMFLRHARMLEVITPTAEAENARAILENFSLEESSEPLEIEAERGLAEEGLSTLAVFKTQEDAEACQAYLAGVDCPVTLKYYAVEERLNLPLYSMIASAPYHLLIPPEEAVIAAEELLNFELPAYDGEEPPASWSCPVCAATSVLLAQGSQKHSTMTTLLIGWGISLPLLLLLRKYLPSGLLVAWLMALPSWALITFMKTKNKTCLHCGHHW